MQTLRATYAVAAQIIWQQVSFNQANDGLGPVGLGTTSGPTGRVGLRGAWTIDGYNGQVWQPYARTNLWRDWGAQATTVFGATRCRWSKSRRGWSLPAD